MSQPAVAPLRIVRDLDRAQTELKRLSSRTTQTQQGEARERVEAILTAVRDRGDAAIADFTERFDGFRPEPMAVSPEALEQAWTSLPTNLRDALELAHRRITDFHQRQRPADLAVTGPHGEQLGRRWRPVERAGLYVPGGRAAYPSTVLMNAVPARVAGVKDVVICSPAGRDGAVNPVVLAAAHLAGVKTVFRLGGAQAVAAMAYGSESVPKVDVISGPGNLYVTLAKQAVYGQVAIDSLAGPSEVLVIADHSAKPDQVAADLLAQAEHDPLAAAVLITTDPALADGINAAVAEQLADHPRQEICEAALRDWGLVVVCDDLESCARLSDSFAPEHLELLVERPEPLADRIQNAGAIFLGPWSPEAVGDYLAGPNHTLPTCGAARFSGALSVETFMRHTSLIGFNRAALEATGSAVQELATSEGLHSHAESVRRRLS
ncbi:MAG: histidinol dehydrogenase [Cyanobacteria bacterium MAG STY4_bin_9]|uniref:histidinol dehydrogenase n=1 Tax=Synechococcus sp. M16.1 TaxID=1442553 RepID=UPI000A6D041E|nr:histidinol dehydrogenase [Synechococcus sp. M16.1]MCY3848358.1 histidinol dehydrogenase [Cyanobacteria bacterium MAG COS4_bin_21]MCY4083280.1 histidinol dehydrogenase [Cyanobacteria bacterium MAG COS1_bin_9]MDD9805133.1 histidinol dehydrogenase [Cyanobacteria bacterium MAG STY1_bin_7]MDD9860980.1 histidinol dehydrogenase [Cyanobacteria bacterium MAG STY2_bin_7]MDD9882735.1 histidinol dehydrogenase [Cyanobacteria bacterium MAG STY4_bin_9]